MIILLIILNWFQHLKKFKKNIEIKFKKLSAVLQILKYWKLSFTVYPSFIIRSEREGLQLTGQTLTVR